MPRLVDYGGRFSFFEEACFAIVRDHGLDDLSRNRLAAVLGTSASTVRRLVNARADLRRLALAEVGQRRRRDRPRPRDLSGTDHAVALLRRLLPDSPQRIAEELVWWRLAVAAPTSATVPPDEVQLDEGPLHHRFAVASHGFVPSDVLHLEVTPPRRALREDGSLDPVVEARTARHEQVADEVAAALAVLDTGLDAADRARVVDELCALVDGLGLGVCLGRTTPQAAVATLRGYLRSLG
ncbi:hypothetical protein GCM10023339_29660 [Alloalcanivorax gelatiniphagus]